MQEIQPAHRHICDMVAMYWNLDTNEVVDGVGDDIAYIQTLTAFVEGNAEAALFYWQDGPPLEFGNTENNYSILN